MADSLPIETESLPKISKYSFVEVIKALKALNGQLEITVTVKAGLL
jgi:hypothetical protein